MDAVGHDVALAEVRHSAGRKLVAHRLSALGWLALGTTVFGLLQAWGNDRSLQDSFWQALLWAGFMGGLLWLSLRGFDRQITALKTLTNLESGQVSHVHGGSVTITLEGGGIQTWRFGRRTQHLSSGQEVWLADVGGAPVALAYADDSDDVRVRVMWSRRADESGPQSQ